MVFLKIIGSLFLVVVICIICILLALFQGRLLGTDSGMGWQGSVILLFPFILALYLGIKQTLLFGFTGRLLFIMRFIATMMVGLIFYYMASLLANSL